MSRFRLAFAVRSGFVFVFFLLLFCLATTAIRAAEPAGLERAMEVQERNTARFLAVEDVVGTGTGLTATGDPAVVVFTARPGVRGIPARLEGVPVMINVSGLIWSMEPPPGKGNGKGGGGKSKIDPKTRFPRPVPIGVSVGNEVECSSGTFGCRLFDGNNVYALSNNHVFAAENLAPLGTAILQPGRFDTNCLIVDEDNDGEPDDMIGALDAFVPISFSGTNRADAAIALSSLGHIDNSTPSNGYGTPKSVVVAAFVGQKVQKYGRTTGQTKGEVTVINATVSVGYNAGTALFENQIIVQSRKPVIKPGDSGSLLVTDPGRHPVGLMFAGTSDGKLAIANDIADVLFELSVAKNEFLTIDGE